ncbi:MAG TPA: type II toxin-antitoxin system prevent-host-death family antitoxin [Acidobacteriota bacterium]|jgi:prevent-host-death family protein
MAQTGVKELKDHLSEYLRRVRKGERVTITDRGEPIAALVPAQEGEEVRWAWKLAEKHLVAWSGGRPQGALKAPKVRGKSAAEIVLEDRR